MLPKPYILTVKDRRMITPQVLHLGFDYDGEEHYHFTPGQFITIHFEHEGKILRRSYSIATIAGKSPLIEIAVSHVEGGPGTEYLFGLHLEDKIQATGPFGRLILGNELPKRYLLIATGTGVTPYRAMLPEIEQRLTQQQDLEVLVLQGVRTPHDLLYADDFLEVMSRNPRFKFYACYSREFPAQAAAHEIKGYVSHLIKQLSIAPHSDVVYLCGNPNMIDETFAYLKEQALPTENIRREKYISPMAKK